MLSLLMIIVLPVALLLYLLKFTDVRVYLCIRASLVTFAVCVLCSLPVGVWETKTIDVSERDHLETTKYMYVVPCEHFDHESSYEAHITPVYTSFVNSVFCEDLTEVAYCDKCHSRKAAIKDYLAVR